MVQGYRESLRIFRDLIEQENIDAGLDDEYVRGGVELLADMFGVPGVYHAERKEQVMQDLRDLPIAD
jgi:hypothetical protein